MRQLTNKNSGFTLIEIIVVLIIVGVLAAIALPNLFGNVAKSRGAEAIATFSPMKSQLLGCGMKNGTPAAPNFTACSAGTLGASGNFFYELFPQATDCTATVLAAASTPAAVGAAGGFCLKASLGAATSAVNNIVFFGTGAGANPLTCRWYGTYAGIC